MIFYIVNVNKIIIFLFLRVNVNVPFQGQGLVLAGFYFCFTWLFAYPALLRFPDREIPDFYPIFIMLHTWDGL